VPSTLAPQVLATVHPSSILRAPDAEARRREMQRFVRDLRCGGARVIIWLMVLPRSLAPSFLLSMPQLMDPNFSRTVVLLCKHSEEGAFGLVVNRPLVTTGRVTVNLDPPVSTDRELQVWVGGPVEPHRSWVLVGEEPDEAEELRGMKIADGLYLSTSPDLLRAPARTESAGAVASHRGIFRVGTGSA
jgi:hypothetical protein